MHKGPLRWINVLTAIQFPCSLEIGHTVLQPCALDIGHTVLQPCSLDIGHTVLQQDLSPQDDDEECSVQDSCSLPLVPTD